MPMVSDDPLVGLKDTLLDKVNTRDVAELRAVLVILVAVKPQWIAAAYHYKGKEIATLVRDTAAELRGECGPRRRKLPELLDTLSADAEKLANEFWEAECAWKRGE